MDHVKFLMEIPEKEDSIEFLQASHLKVSALYWSLTAAHLLDAFDQIYPPERLKQVVRFLEKCYKSDGGFAGNEGPHDSHLLFTLSAIQILKMMNASGYPEWFNLDKTVNYVVGLQKEDGSFAGDKFGEIDTRFTYCAVAALSLLNRLDALDPQLTRKFVDSCRNFDGGFGALPGSESHGGNIFCCISALKIIENHQPSNDRNACADDDDDDDLIDWLVWRQLPCGGFNGRPEKLPDVCYSWWILSTLKTLKAVDRISLDALRNFISNCRDVHGGFADRPGDVADIFHTLFALTGLALVAEETKEDQNLPKIDPLYCLPRNKPSDQE